MNRFCRTCLHSIPKDSLFFQLDGQDPSSVALLIKSQLQACVPEMRVGVIKNPVLCNPCLNDLTSAYRFRNKCLETEKQILDYIVHTDSSTTHVDINLLIKRLANNSNNSSQKYENDERPHSPSLVRHGYCRKKNSPSKECKIRYKKDCTIDVEVENSGTVKSSFIKDNNSTGKLLKHENNLANLMSSDIKMVGAFSECISIDDISASIINGIKKNPLKFPQFTIKTILGDCIDITDSDIEDFPEMLNNDDVSLPQLTMNNNKMVVEPSNTLEDDPKTVNSFPTIATTNKNCSQIGILETAILSCDNNHIPILKAPKSDKDLTLKKSFKKCVKSCNSKNKKIKKNIKEAKNVINIKDMNSQLFSISNKSSAIKKPSKNQRTAKTRSENSAALIETTEDFLAFEPLDNSSSINGTKNQFNEGIHLRHRIETKNIPFSYTAILGEELVTLETCSTNDIKEECETGELSTQDECRAIQIKDEVIIKDECEFQHHKNKLQEIHASYARDDNDELFSNENKMEVDELQSQSVEASTSQQFQHSEFLNRTSVDDFNSKPLHRKDRRLSYSCAVCSYSCNSESVLVAHTKIHINKSSYKYDDNLMFCGFTRDNLKCGGCISCKYAKSETFLMWLKPEVHLTKYVKPERGK